MENASNLLSVEVHYWLMIGFSLHILETEMHDEWIIDEDCLTVSIRLI